MKTRSAKTTSQSRRRFIVGSATVAGGGLALGLPFALDAGSTSAAAAKTAPAVPEVNAWVVVMPDERCVIRIARSEMGQGTMTGLAQLVVEELECDWKKVATEFPTPGESLARKRVWGEMGTGGSRGIRTSQDYVRKGGAAARMMLLQAAADQWKVPVGELTVSNGVITHAASKRTTTYGKVAPAAAKLTPPDPASIKLKDPKDWKIAGKPMKRLDTADKLNGRQVYAIDIKLPGMRCAAIKDCPVFGGKLVSFDESKIAGRAGSASRRAGQRFDGRRRRGHVVARRRPRSTRCPIVWGRRLGSRRSRALRFAAHLQEGLAAPTAYAMRNEGDALKAIAGAAKKVEAEYSTPFLAHATMEPMNCTGENHRRTAPRCWVATQNARRRWPRFPKRPGCRSRNARSTSTCSAEGFGRRGGAQDYVRQAVDIAKQFPGVPIKMVWSREEDMTHDFYRPISQCRASAGLDEKGNLVGLHVRVSGQSINAFLNQAAAKDGRDDRQLQGYYAPAGDAQLGYTVPNLLVEYAMRNTHVPVGPWRGVNTNQNAVYMECFIDEVARAANADPVEFRRALMQKHPEAPRRCSMPSRRRPDWGKPLPAGRPSAASRSSWATAAIRRPSPKSRSTTKGKLKVHRMVLGVDCGPCGQSRPDRGAGRGLGRVRLERDFLRRSARSKKAASRRPTSTPYEILRLKDMPKVETVIVPSFDFWGGRRRADDLRRRAPR
jgi:isoquinoline 1-oxidoreductase beta subunit